MHSFHHEFPQISSVLCCFSAGFVVFYDLVLGAEVSQRALHLVAALYSEGQEVGPLTALPPAQYLPYTHSLAPANYALLSFKQSVPRYEKDLHLSAYRTVE